MPDLTPPEPVEARNPMPVEDIIGAFVGSLREPDVMAALSDEGYTVCGPDCGCSCLRADTARVPEGLRALSDAATPGPWRWYAQGPGEGDISLGQEDNLDEFHVLTPHVCASCEERHAPCLAPSQADAALIEAAVNYVRAALATSPEGGSDD